MVVLWTASDFSQTKETFLKLKCFVNYSQTKTSEVLKSGLVSVSAPVFRLMESGIRPQTSGIKKNAIFQEFYVAVTRKLRLLNKC